MKNDKVIIKWIVEKIWIEWSFLEYEISEKKVKINHKFQDHKESISQIFKLFLEKVIKSLDEINAIGHRVVHGWEYFSDSVIIDDKVIEKIKECSILAPLHNPANLMGIFACRDLIPSVKQVAVFDTAFHQSMKSESFLYAIPYRFYQDYKIRKYWFHGTSHKYVYQKLLELEKDNNLKVITCHIGNWASISAIKDWNVIDTSMWFTPLEWLVMWTRSGDLDPAVVTYLMKKEKLSPDEIENILNKKSGLLWLSEKSSDMRDIIDWYKSWDEKSQNALNIFVNRILKYIGAYVSILNWLDVIVFTAWVLERSSFVRKMIVDKLWRLWITLNEKINEKCYSAEQIISTKNSKVKVIVIPTNEELMIAKDTYHLVSL